MAMPSVPRMPRSKRRQLIREGRQSGDPATATRFTIVAKLAAGQRQAEVARALEVAPATASRVAAAFREHGLDGLRDRRQDNGATKVDEKFLVALAETLVGVPTDTGWQRPTWTRELLCKELERRGFVAVSLSTMGRALARLGARLGTPKPIVLCPWKSDAREARLAQIRKLERRASPEEPVLYADEVDIDLNPKIGKDWMLRGHQRRVVTPGKNEKFYLAGALDVLTGKLRCTGLPNKNSALFCQLLWHLAKTYRRARRIHLIVDNYGIHSSHQTQSVLESLGGRIVLHFLPPYCPDANRIERVWQDLHANVTRNHRCKTLATLLDNARSYVDAYQWRRPSTTRALRKAA